MKLLQKPAMVVWKKGPISPTCEGARVTLRLAQELIGSASQEKHHKEIFPQTIMDFLTEQQPWGKTLYEIQPGSHTSFQTRRQQVDLITNSHFGRMLFLDGVLQSTTSDEAKYHRILVDLGIHRDSQHVLIVGGAEGGVAREVLQNPDVESVVMVDWDRELVEYCRDTEKWNQLAFADPRLELVFEDVRDFATECKREFDTIYIDLLDVTTSEEFDFFMSVFDNLAFLRSRDTKTRIVANFGRSKRFLQNIHERRMKVHKVHVPSFQEAHYLVSWKY